MSGRAPWEVLRRRLEERGFHPSRRLGQNFLLDENMLRAVVREAGLAPGDRVLEIGPGLGFLTRHLLAAGAELVCVEIDPRLLELARETLGEAAARVRWIQGDALAGKHALSRELEAALAPWERWQLVSNLPYSAAGPLLALLAARENAPERMTFLVQREVGERLCSRAGGAAWGPLSIAVQLSYRVRIARLVPAQLFWPRPEVESALVVCELDPQRPAAPERASVLELVRLLFSRRRQSLARVLAARHGRRGAEQALAALGLEGARRAETLDLATLRALARELPGPAPAS